MPPEQARGEEAGPASDVYSLGATLYCLVTGRPPFQAATLMETLRILVENEPVAPHWLNPGLDRDLEVICLKCLHKEAVSPLFQRLSLAQDLGRYLAGEPIEARPVGPAEKVVLWSRKNRGLATMSAAVLVLSLMMIVGSVLYTVWLSTALKDVSAALKARNAALQAKNAALKDANQKLVRQYVLERHEEPGRGRSIWVRSPGSPRPCNWWREIAARSGSIASGSARCWRIARSLSTSSGWAGHRLPID